MTFLAVAGLAVALVVRHPISRHLRGIGEAVCQGVPAQASAPYDSAGSPPHGILIMWDSLQSIRKREYPAGWLPSSDSALELVACVSLHWQTVETCRYNIGPDIRRVRATLATRVIAAHTGRTVAVFDLQGTEPPTCPGHAAVQLDTLEGSVPGRREYLDSRVAGSLRRLVEGKGASEAEGRPADSAAPVLPGLMPGRSTQSVP
jgi:hypothetical protein